MSRTATAGLCASNADEQTVVSPRSRIEVLEVIYDGGEERFSICKNKMGRGKARPDALLLHNPLTVAIAILPESFGPAVKGEPLITVNAPKSIIHLTRHFVHAAHGPSPREG